MIAFSLRYGSIVLDSLRLTERLKLPSAGVKWPTEQLRFSVGLMARGAYVAACAPLGGRWSSCAVGPVR